MALIRQIQEKEEHKRANIHGEVEATFVIFEKDGETYLQIDTYGSPNRAEMKVSQSIQLGKEGRDALRTLLAKIE
ncbi:hypothetical protein [Celeribacter sp.]|uniref:hypothetical protein n=1 Tax=Celeribacter sp. TaxID=1890673 RepID=UPI003A919185